MDTGNYLDDIDEAILTRKRRRKLLPWWMKFFIWLFIVTGILTIPIFIVGTVGTSFDMQFYGLSANKPLTITGISLLLVFILKAFASYSLWFEKNWGITLALFDAYLGLAICLVIMTFPIVTDRTEFTFRPEVIVLIPYIVKLHSLKKYW
jgi:hypothetical protein